MARLRILPTLGTRGIAIGLLCALICWCLSGTKTVRHLENWSLDMCYAFRETREGPTEIVIIAIDDATLDSYREPLMFITPELSEVVHHVRESGAKVVGIDFMIADTVHDVIYLGEEQDGDACILGDLRDNKELCPVVLPELLVSGGSTLVEFPVRQWQPSSVRSTLESLSAIYPDYDPKALLLIDGPWTSMGFVNESPDDDMALRRQKLKYELNLDDGSHTEPSFAFAVYAAAQGFDEAHLRDSTLPAADDESSPRVIPVDKDGNLMINFRGPPATIQSVSFKDVLQAARSRKRSDDWRNKIVLIGENYHSSPDRFATPFSNPSIIRSLWSGKTPELMPGVEVHANVIATLGDRNFITTPWLLNTPLLLIVNGILLGVLLLRVNLELSLLITFVHHWLWKLICILAFHYFSWRIEMVPVLQLGLLACAVVFALRWRWIRRMMGMVKSEAIARAFEADPSKLDLKGEDREMTILFSDIRNFTSYSESHSPHEAVKLLNEYFAVVVPVIEKHGGVVNSYIGDGIMVMFGAPNTLESHAACAIRAGIEMVDLVHQQQQLWEKLDAPEFRIGVGIHTGNCVAGTVGSPRRLDYTAIGDAVNTASRIESGNKELGTEILASKISVEAIPNDADGLIEFVGEPLSLKVKGKQDVLEVYEIRTAAVRRD